MENENNDLNENSDLSKKQKELSEKLYDNFGILEKKGWLK